MKIMKTEKAMLEDFIVDICLGKVKPIKQDSGDFNEYRGKYEINYSSVLTRLIQEAGKCEYYASDLFFDWNYMIDILENIDQPKDFSLIRVFGFRESGVDHKAFVDSRLDCPACYGRKEEIYHGIYVLTLECRESGEVKMNLYRYF